ncbi:MFS transporter [Ruminiclostridium cellobioparum]|uniref:Major Facilitator Superfamily n=1 Tax=Ruminiclostridium cellobioparum subsp. termitidis CT1112 TaxID=1195236 RepID=S0FPS6_RUMCE|nr:MFS transporter [Ruminiclostridium cellobioparum]EMS71194.1 Major Facilitator Superfamily [Ruminiclostridium cellobioparum subsp. termitidis CT1112]
MGIRYIFDKLGLINRTVTDDNLELSRRRFVLEGCLANAIFTLTSGAFLVGYASYLGANEQFNGIIVALPLLANIIQLFSPLVFEKLSRRRPLIVALCLFYRTLLCLMMFIPFVTDSKPARLLILGGMYFLAYCAAGFLTPAAASWIISLVPDKLRGRYFGMRDMCILASAAVLSLVMGRVLDLFKSNRQDYLGFVVVFSVALVITLFNVLTLKRIREPEVKPYDQNLDIKGLISIPLRDKQFRKVVLLNILWNLSVQFSLPFFSVYMVNGLKLSYTYIMVIGIILSCVQSYSARIWGRISEKKSWEFTTVASMAVLGVVHVTWSFINHNTYFVIIPFVQVLAGIGWAGVNMSLFNIQFKYAPQEGRTVFIGFNAALAGAAGFFSALMGSFVVGALSGIKIDIKVAVLDNMLIVFGISGFMILCCAAYFSWCFKDKKEELIS